MRTGALTKGKRVRLPCAVCLTTAALLLVATGHPTRATEPETLERPLPETAVVFTGTRNRVLWGLRLLEGGEIRRLLISGISEEMFARQFRLTPTLREARQEGRLVLGTRAQSTLENGAETACWLKAEGLPGPILLITSNQHLARATAALANAAPDIAVRTLGVMDPRSAKVREEEASELAKLAMTRALRFLPQSLSVREGFSDCSGMQFR